MASTTESVQALVLKRQKNLDYLKRVHEGKVHWLNVIKLSRSQILKFFTPEQLQKRVSRYFLLGISVGKVLEMSLGCNVVRALVQLLEEFEFHISKAPKDAFDVTNYGGGGKQAAMIAHVHFGQSLLVKSSSSSLKDTIKAQIHKVGKQVVYEHLQAHPLPIKGALDYFEVFFSLCDILSLAYSKFLDHSCQSSPAVLEAILKIDKKLKSLVFSKVCNDLTLMAIPLVKDEFRTLLSGLFIDKSKSESRVKKLYNLRDDRDDWARDFFVSEEKDEQQGAFGGGAAGGGAGTAGGVGGGGAGGGGGAAAGVGAGPGSAVASPARQ